MQQIKLKYIDWDRTATNLKLLRNDNINLRRYVCSSLNLDKGECDGRCETCKYDMDNSISQKELARVFNVSDSMIINWENGKSRPALEYLIFYSEICRISLYDVIVFAG